MNINSTNIELKFDVSLEVNDVAATGGLMDDEECLCLKRENKLN